MCSNLHITNFLKGVTDIEKQKLLDEIGRMTAQVLGAEEAINYRDKQLKDLQKENKSLKEEIENTIPVLRAQVIFLAINKNIW